MSASPFTGARIDRCLARRVVPHSNSVESQGISQTNPASEQLAQQATLIFELLDLAPVLAYDLEGRIVVWTSGDEALYGWSKEEVSGTKAHDLLQTTCAEPLAEINDAVSARGSWEGVLVRTD